MNPPLQYASPLSKRIPVEKKNEEGATRVARIEKMTAGVDQVLKELQNQSKALDRVSNILSTDDRSREEVSSRRLSREAQGVKDTVYNFLQENPYAREKK